MKQTAVEWLEFRYKNNINLMDYDFEQAKEMEKQHIIDANWEANEDTEKDIIEWFEQFKKR